MSDDRQAHIFEQQIKMQTKAVHHFIEHAKNIGIDLAPKDLLEMVENYKNKLLQEMLHQRLGMATPTEVTSWFEATKRLAESSPTDPSSQNSIKEPATKNKRKRRTRN